MPTLTKRLAVPHAVYDTVKKKEAGRIKEAKEAAALAGDAAEPSFADVLKQQWEERKKEMEASKER